MSTTKRMLVENLAWASEQAHLDPAFFGALARGQSPSVLWLGCSDSRVPAETITNAPPGELFVHRNIANLFLPEDGNTMSVLEYAVQVLRVGHVVVCGHTGCGGVRAALAGVPPGMPHLARRIQPLCALARRHGGELDALEESRRVDRLAALNVLEQVRRIRDSAVLRAMPTPPRVHGWLFDLADGRLRVLDDADAAVPAVAEAAA